MKNPNKYLFIILILQCCTLVSNAQQVDSSYLLYPKQFEEITKVRGLYSYEIESLLNEYKENNIKSNSDFASLLQYFYPKSYNDKIGILLYFYHDNKLRRLFFEPGIIIEDKTLEITKEHFLNLSNQLNHSLRLNAYTANRAPRPRGAEIESDENPALDLNLISDSLTKILLPSNLDYKYEHLVIIPSLNIGTIPFALLKPYSDKSYLIDHCSYVIAPTLLDFIFLRKKIIAFAKSNNIRWERNPEITYTLENPVFISNPTYPTHTNYFFPDLPGAEREVDSIKKYCTNYKLFKGSYATKDSVLKYLNGSDVAYFATHGVGDLVDPLKKSYLVLSGNDPFLTSKEIQDLRLLKDYKAPEMVILSACQTGLGKTMEGGLAGSLARSFILSGSNYILESLWSVDDEATAFMMNRFIYYINKGSKNFPSDALKSAIIDTKQKYPNPIYWASFCSFGISL